MGNVKFWPCLPGCFKNAGKGAEGATGAKFRPSVPGCFARARNESLTEREKMRKPRGLWDASRPRPGHVRRELVVIGCGRKSVWSGDAKFWSCLPGCFEHAGEGVKGGDR